MNSGGRNNVPGDAAWSVMAGLPDKTRFSLADTNTTISAQFIRVHDENALAQLRTSIRCDVADGLPWLFLSSQGTQLTRGPGIQEIEGVRSRR